MHPALLLLLPLASLLHVATAAGNGNETSRNTSCMPVRCGNLTIRYPFSLGGVQPLYCGYPVLDLTCDNGTAYLSRTFRDHLYRVKNISYETGTMAVTVEATFAGDAGCRIPDFNVTSSLAAYPFVISNTANEYLTFVYNFSRPQDVRHRLSCGNHTMEMGGECRFPQLTFECVCPNALLCSNSTSGHQGKVNRGSKVNRGIKIATGTAAAVVCLTILGIGSTLLYARRKRKRSASLEGLIRGGTPLPSLTKEFSLTGLPYTHIFTYEELDEATDGFSDARELGVGGFGTVYKGTLRDGSTVAVKRLYKNSYKSVEQFQNEVGILSRLRHPNLVTLYGCTSQTNSRDLLLVYEFVPNGTLADHLHGGGAAAQALDWPTRLDIAVETASALEYLHTVEPQVVHRDVKTNNILLDEGFHVKVADFGLSRLFPADATHVSTAPQGTPGYLDPMYHQCYQLTDKSDVYSFGVVLVELISSKPAVDMNRRGSDVNLANMAVNMIQSYEMEQLVDPQLGYGSDSETRRTVDLVAEVAFRCLQPEQDVRPPISEVLDALREAQRMDKVDCVKDDAGLLKKSRDGSPDCVMYQWISPSTTSNNSS
ncbi:hypothetical protein E2562_000833 [Oryza meyeriana var. granulata]|uniref:Protein kinase domain-containing protein n=1 Tax=Oryza meyeriana var. granulata TaxID=110450 RepID=A0A6G1CY21_9ORYZ|nr:hypothetical protein E2562_000833 [Oryza meyeriana var. granulata]